MITIEYDAYGLAGMWTDDRNVDLMTEMNYVAGYEPPRYPVPAIPVIALRSTRGKWLLIVHKHSRKLYAWWHKRPDGSIHHGWTGY